MIEHLVQPENAEDLTFEQVIAGESTEIDAMLAQARQSGAESSEMDAVVAATEVFLICTKAARINTDSPVFEADAPTDEERKQRVADLTVLLGDGLKGL